MLIPLPSAGASPVVPKTPLVSDFGLGDDKTISRTVEGVVNPLVSAKLLVKSNLSDIDASAVISKSITTSATSAGQITDTGAGDGVGALQFELAQSETALLTSAKYYYITVVDSAGNTYILERGLLSAGVPVANPNGRKRVGNWNLNTQSIEPPSGGSRLLFQELIDDLDQGEVYSFSRKIQGTLPVGYTLGNLTLTVRRAGTDPDGAAIVAKVVTPGAVSPDATYPVTVNFTAVDTAKFVGAMVWDAKVSMTNGGTTKRYTVAIGTIYALGPLPAVGVQTPAVYTMAIANPPTVGFIPVQLVLTMADVSSNPIAPATRDVRWGTSNKAVATVSPSGLITAVANGTCDIVATCEQVEVRSTVTISALVFSVTITPNPITALAIGATQALTVVLKDAANNVLTGRTIVYTSTDPSIASVDGSGVVHGIAPGAVTITASSEGISNTTAVTVPVPVALVLVTPNPISVFTTSTQQLTVVTKDSLGNVLTGRTITYNSTDPTKATVSGTGLVSGVAAGTTTITASSEGITSSADVATVTVDPYAGYDVYDSVTRANSTTTAGTPTEKGSAYVALSGVWGVLSNKIYTVSGVDVYLQAGATVSGNGTAEIDITDAAWATDAPGLFFRSSDVNNLLLGVLTSTTAFTLYQKIAGTYTSLGALTVSITNGSTHTLKLAWTGTSVAVSLDGSPVAGSPYTLSGAAAALAGKNAGLRNVIASTTTGFKNYHLTG